MIWEVRGCPDEQEQLSLLDNASEYQVGNHSLYCLRALCFPYGCPCSSAVFTLTSSLFQYVRSLWRIIICIGFTLGQGPLCMSLSIHTCLHSFQSTCWCPLSTHLMLRALNGSWRSLIPWCQIGVVVKYNCTSWVSAPTRPQLNSHGWCHIFPFVNSYIR